MSPRQRQLQAVLRQRRLVEEDHRRAVAALERERVEVESRLRRCGGSFESIRADLREALDPSRAGARLEFDDVRAQAGASLAARGRLHALAIQAAGVNRRLESARADLARAAASRRAVEHLLERLRAERAARAERREAAELDEFSTARAARADDPAMEPSP
ncbi:MAG: hypothetical protein D6693_02545 [Planctomycetota bacterium]|nr:MAG: hypothetical protein D6693_02545 [Planctomycetota bacterium]